MPREEFSSRYDIETIDVNALVLPHPVRKVGISKHNRPPALEWVELADEVLLYRLPRKHSNRGALNAPRELIK